jgi:aspartate-semialdehyde dehydrogenase
MGYKVAVVGATGNVGREMLNILDERKFPPTRWWRWRRAAAWASKCPMATAP